MEDNDKKQTSEAGSEAVAPETLHGDDFYDKRRRKMRRDPFAETRRRIRGGRVVTYIIAGANFAATLAWMISSFMGKVTGSDTWYVVIYGAAILASCVGLCFAKEWARKLMGIPAVMLGIPVITSMIINPAAIPLFVKNSYQVATQIVSVGLLYFLPWCSAFFNAQPNARKRALAKLPADANK